VQNVDLAGLLKHVPVGGAGLDLSNFPDFLIAGPQRTGSTWLCTHLSRHPEIFVAGPRELYYFNRLNDPENFWRISEDPALFPSRDRFLTAPRIRNALRALRLYWKFGRLRNPAHPKHRSPDLSWYLRFFRDTTISFLRKWLYCRLRHGECSVSTQMAQSGG